VQRLAKVQVSLRQAGLQPDNLTQLGDRLIRLSLEVQLHAKEKVRLVQVGIQPKCRTGLRDGCVAQAALTQDKPQNPMGEGVVGIARDLRATCGNGGVKRVLCFVA
jgi:hypothetical protein